MKKLTQRQWEWLHDVTKFCSKRADQLDKAGEHKLATHLRWAASHLGAYLFYADSGFYR